MYGYILVPACPRPLWPAADRQHEKTQADLKRSVSKMPQTTHWCQKTILCHLWDEYFKQTGWYLCTLGQYCVHMYITYRSTCIRFKHPIKNKNRFMTIIYRNREYFCIFRGWISFLYGRLNFPHLWCGNWAPETLRSLVRGIIKTTKSPGEVGGVVPNLFFFKCLLCLPWFNSLLVIVSILADIRPVSQSEVSESSSTVSHKLFFEIHIINLKLIINSGKTHKVK